MNEKQQAALDAIHNFILYYASDEDERDRIFQVALDYVWNDHVLAGDDDV